MIKKVRVYVLLLELGIEEVHMWHNVVKKFQKELKVQDFIKNTCPLG